MVKFHNLDMESKNLDSLDELATKLGSPEEHLENFNRIMAEIEEYRKNNKSARKRYNENINRARELVEKYPLIHSTSGEHFQEAQKEIKPTRLIGGETNHMPIDTGLGLDNFVFATFGRKIVDAPPYGGIPLYLNPDLLNREGTIFTIEDIAIMSLRYFEELSKRFICGGYDERIPETEEKVKQDYLKSIMPGNKFREFMADFIATYYRNPEVYFFNCSGRPDIPHSIKADKYWVSPEIKIYGRVSDKNFVKSSFSISNKSAKKKNPLKKLLFPILFSYSLFIYQLNIDKHTELERIK